MESKRTFVVTPTVGTAELRRCLESVQAQTLENVEHIIVVDGPQYLDKVQKLISEMSLGKPIHTMVLPFNVGAGGWCGHRVYASIPFLLDSEFVAYLDEDNWYDTDHLECLHKALNRHKADWAFSLRKIFNKAGDFVTNDNCESLGTFSYTLYGGGDFLVDTSCYLFTTYVARAVAPHWMHRARQDNEIEADRAVTRFLLNHPSFRGAGSEMPTLNYTAWHGRTQELFFINGNAFTRYDFQQRKRLYVFHFSPSKTSELLGSLHKDDRSYAMDEWQMTLLRGLRGKVNLINGYAMGSSIPRGSVIFVSLCHAEELPMTTGRPDLRRIAYTVESPNILHQQQWELSFLKAHFDRLLTYWEPILQGHPGAVFCPHNTHHLDFENPLDTALLHTPAKPVGKDVVMVLACRHLTGDYVINEHSLQCLDPLRKAYVEKLKDVTVYGIGWDGYKDNPLLKVGHTKDRSMDELSTVDILKNFTFVLIVENTNADGYVSEKIYDAFIAGCIPIYYGNNNARVAIPETMYIDLKRYPTSEKLQDYLDSLTMEEIDEKRQFILNHREEVLRRVSTKAFADTLLQVLDDA